MRADGAAVAERVNSIAPEDRVVRDATGIGTTLTRLSARAPRGQPADGTPGHGRRRTVLGARTRGGVVAVMTVAAATDGPVFQAVLQPVPIPGRRQHKPGATIVIDHLDGPSRRPSPPALLESAGFALLPVPRDTPDLSPIELCWCKLKTPLRTAEPRSIDTAEEQIGPALDTITPQDAKGWFRHCGYSTSN